MGALKFVLLLIVFDADDDLVLARMYPQESMEECHAAQERVSAVAQKRNDRAFTDCVEVQVPDKPKFKKDRDS